MTDALKQRLQEIEDLKNIAERIWFDQQTHMPSGALAERIRQTGLLQSLIQRRLTSDELGQLLEAETSNAAVIDIARRDRADALRLGDGRWQRFLEVGAEAFGVWEEARRVGDWAAFEPWLAELVKLNRNIADSIGYQSHPLDALLSFYAPGPTFQELYEILGDLRAFLIRARQARSVLPQETSTLVEPHLLLRIAEDVGKLVGFDLQRGGVAFSPHGYTSAAGPNDVRISFRRDVPLFEAVSTIVHEYGHGLYSQNIDPALVGTPGQSGSMPYIQESQAKFWENIVGRSPEFSQQVGNILSRRLGERSPDEWSNAYHRALTTAEVSPIRIASDEISFNLHILLRLEIELELINGSASVRDVPRLWNEKSEEYLGITPETLRDGPLQDPHWTRRVFGLFSSYIIGNVASAQLAEAMGRDGVDIAKAGREGNYERVVTWLRENVHRPGRTISLQDMLRDATGSRLRAAPYKTHLHERYQLGME